MSEKHANPYMVRLIGNVNRPTWAQVVAAGGQNARDLKVTVRHG